MTINNFCHAQKSTVRIENILTNGIKCNSFD